MSTSTLTYNSRRNPELTRREILNAALEEFAHKGLLGSRIDVIVSKTNTSKRMIYYYFGSKASLYTEVLKESYARIRQREIDLNLDDLEPEKALRTFIRETLEHFERNIDAVRIIAYENLQCEGTTIASTPEILNLDERTLEILEGILSRGHASGVFRDDDDAPTAVDVHQVLSALALNRVEHRGSFNVLFGRDMLGPEEAPRNRTMIEDAVLRLVLKNPRTWD